MKNCTYCGLLSCVKGGEPEEWNPHTGELYTGRYGMCRVEVSGCDPIDNWPCGLHVEKPMNEDGHFECEDCGNLRDREGKQVRK